MHCDINFDVLSKAAPEESLAFAQGLLAGNYTVNKTEQDKKVLRQQLQEDLQTASVAI